MEVSLTTKEREVEIGGRLRDLRLRLNVDQRQLAGQAGVALNVVKRLEGGKGSTLASLIRVLRALGREDWLATLAPQVTVSPLQVLRTRKAMRQRASPSRDRTRVQAG